MEFDYKALLDIGLGGLALAMYYRQGKVLQSMDKRLTRLEDEATKRVRHRIKRR